MIYKKKNNGPSISDSGAAAGAMKIHQIQPMQKDTREAIREDTPGYLTMTFSPTCFLMVLVTATADLGTIRNDVA